MRSTFEFKVALSNQTRSANRCELDMAIKQCRAAGIEEVLLRGDWDFSITENFDPWEADSVKFVLGSICSVFSFNPVASGDRLTEFMFTLKRKLGGDTKIAFVMYVKSG